MIASIQSIVMQATARSKIHFCSKRKTGVPTKLATCLVHQNMMSSNSPAHNWSPLQLHMLQRHYDLTWREPALLSKRILKPFDKWLSSSKVLENCYAGELRFCSLQSIFLTILARKYDHLTRCQFLKPKISIFPQWKVGIGLQRIPEKICLCCFNSTESLELDATDEPKSSHGLHWPYICIMPDIADN